MLTPKKLTLVGTGFYGYIHSLSAAFGRSGVDVTTFAYPNVRCGWRSLPTRFGFQVLENVTRRRILKATLGAARGSDMVLLLRGDLFYPDDLRRIASSFCGPLVVWAIDSIYRMRKGVELCKNSDIVFLYNKEEADDCSANGRPVFFLPLGYDDRFYRPLASKDEEIDIYYVGTFHPDRKVILNEILGALEGKGYRIVVDGKIVPGRRPFMKQRLLEDYPHLLRVASNRAVDHTHINSMTNKARVCLNILPDHAFSGLNTRAFEIGGAGGFQLISHNSGVGSFFEDGGEIASYQDTTELVARLLHHLDPKNEEERVRIAARGHKRSRMAHTFDCRVNEFLEKVRSA